MKKSIDKNSLLVFSVYKQLLLLAATCCQMMNAHAFVEKINAGTAHYRYTTFYGTDAQAYSACIPFAESHGYAGENVCMGKNGSTTQGVLEVTAGWLWWSKGVHKVPFSYGRFRFEPDCSPVETLDLHQGCVNKNSGLDCPSQTGGTNPINLGVGNKYQSERDFSSYGIFPLEVNRHYNSLSGDWVFFSEIRLAGDFSNVLVRRPNGKEFIVTADGQGDWITDPDTTGKFERVVNSSGDITGWRYTTLNQQVEEYDTYGKLLSITDRTGLSHTFVYAGSTITVTHSNGQTLIYHLTGGLISGFTTPDNETYSYSHDSKNNLATITYPNNGGIRTYHYENANFPRGLTGITDANGDRFATWDYDSQGRAISSEHNGGVDLVTIDYTYLDDAIDPRSTVTNPLGKQTTYHFTTLHGVRKVTQVEGHASTSCAAANKNYIYDTNGFLAAKTDWQGNITTYTRNAKGQELSRTEASGTSEERTITSQWHNTYNRPIKITEPGKETVFTYDTNGNELTKTITETTL